MILNNCKLQNVIHTYIYIKHGTKWEVRLYKLVAFWYIVVGMLLRSCRLRSGHGTSDLLPFPTLDFLQLQKMMPALAFNSMISLRG